ncbi:MAG: hypothetical protein K9H61_05660 [Bacteroidia bacterium]|nr:hypothetical protein [Bacteroidia bacterium]MCF8427053.1 hypothetical protein [Bacteroidia bacterium]MCF8446463.1 hypothetical protein [Bacteroidia bacterium]
MLQFCSISSSSHLFKSFALADSLAVFGYKLHVLVTDSNLQIDKPKNVELYFIQNLVQTELLKKFSKKYLAKRDKLRWGLKPFFLLFLLEKFEKVVYVDNDTYFFGNPSTIEKLLETSTVILTPHFYPSNPQREQNWLEANFRVGLYNAGFVAAKTSAKEALAWWAECCYYNLKKLYRRGLFDDQKYLDLMPVLFENILILKDKGYNLAAWNSQNYEMERNSTGEVFLSKEFLLVFIHFSHISIKQYSRQGHFLFNEYTRYLEHLRKYNSKYQFTDERRWYELGAYFNFICWKIQRLVE